MSHRCTVKSRLSASAKGCHNTEENGVPWQNTTAGPVPDRPHAIWRPCHSIRSSSSMRDFYPRTRTPTRLPGPNGREIRSTLTDSLTRHHKRADVSDHENE